MSLVCQDTGVEKLHNRPCLLWTHDETFSREQVLFNLGAFPENSVSIGDLVKVIPVPTNSDIRDFQQKYDSNTQDSSGDVVSQRALASTIRKLPAEKPPSVAEHGPQRDTGHGAENHKHCIFVVKPMPADMKHPGLQLSITNSIANAFGLRNRSQVRLSMIDRKECSASHAEIVFRDEYLSRADMWRLTISELADEPVYKGQKILFMGTIKATIKTLYVRGRKVSSAYFSPQTIPIFRSESARFVIFIQMSKEMWDFDSEGTGEIMFSRVINGFLPELFKRWQKIKAHHLVSIVMFTRLEYDRRVTADINAFRSEAESLFGSSKAPPNRLRDFYRVVVSDMASGQWTLILNELKREFRTFLRDVSVQKVDASANPASLPSSLRPMDQDLVEPKAVIAGWPTAALRGNILEAINIASSQFSADYIDRDLIRTGISVVVVTAGTGVFEVDAMALARTTENLTNNGIGIDLVCLSKMPLHSVPLFKYPKAQSRQNPNPTSKGSFKSPSPPLAYSPIGSFPSQTLEVSPSATTEFGSVAGPPSKVMSLEPPEQWDYNIPQWIDISFWTSETEQSRRLSRGSRRNASPARLIRTYQRDFVPRVRMYELQMMGVMEYEMSNIFIPYLSEDMGAPSQTSSLPRTKNRFLQIGSNGAHRWTPSHSPRRSSFGNVMTPLASFRDYAAKRRFLSGHLGQNKKEPSWMDCHDDLIFRRFKKPPKSKEHSKSVDQRQSLATAQSVLDQFPVEDGPLPQNRKADPQTKRETVASDPGRAAKPSASSGKGTSKAKTINDAKPARISRQISFALRGLGVAPPRAVASTEINAENVKAAIQLSVPSTTNLLMPGTKSLGPENHLTSVTTNNYEKLLQADATPSSLKVPPSARIPGASPSRPISIRHAKVDQGEQNTIPLDPGRSFSTATTQAPWDTKNIDIPQKGLGLGELGLEQRKKPESSLGGAETTLQTEKNTSPWIKTINPSNPAKNDPKSAVSFGRWQHVYPHTPRASSVKWKSLCSPAAVPLTTEEFPSTEELAVDYVQVTHEISQSQNGENELPEVPRARDALMRDLISLRLSHGYQIVVGPAITKPTGRGALGVVDIFDTDSLAREGSVVLMSMGNTIQKLVCNTGGRIEVTKYTRKSLSELLDPGNKVRCFTYFAAIRTILSGEYVPREMRVEDLNEVYNWNLVDSFAAGHHNLETDHVETLRFWRARFVLLPVDLPSNARRALHSTAEDSEEEVRLEGIRKITQMWQRYRYIPADERRFQSSLGNRKDPNPLDILYQTRNPSEVVAAELETSLLADTGLESGPTQLLPDSELLQRSSINLNMLAQTIQGEKGITIINRRWHWRFHYSCFIGAELTSWLLQNFRDIDTREEAVELGNELMKMGLFQHVQKRHNFRDGNYFYHIGADYLVTRPDAKGGWFQSRRPDKSVPSTPISETLPKDSPLASRSRSSPNNDEEASDSSALTPTKLSRSRTTVNLSKSLRYDADHRKRSNRPEIIELHYDRIHNPDNCYHFRIDWLNVTSKLIEDAIVTWATTADKYGLKLVEVPMAEACTISDKEPFRSPYLLHLKTPPPSGQTSNFFSTTSFSPQGAVDRAYYQKAILKKFNFVLDLEAATAFPPNVDVRYSWGKPTYRYPQYIHRSGVLLAQITDSGSFVLAANRLYNTRSAATKEAGKLEREDHFYRRSRTHGELVDRASPHPSPLVRATPDVLGGGHAHLDMSNISTTPEHIGRELEAFCNDAEQLAAFYDATSPKSSPGPGQSPLEVSIPSLQLPPGLVGQGRSPSPSPQVGARGVGPRNATENGQSPRGSDAENV